MSQPSKFIGQFTSLYRIDELLLDEHRRLAHFVLNESVDRNQLIDSVRWAFRVTSFNVSHDRLMTDGEQLAVPTKPSKVIVFENIAQKTKQAWERHRSCSK